MKTRFVAIVLLAFLSPAALAADTVSGKVVRLAYDTTTTMPDGCVATPEPVPKDSPSPVKVRIACPGQTFDVTLEFSMPDLPEGRFDPALKRFYPGSEFKTTVKSTVAWTRSDADGIPYTGQLVTATGTDAKDPDRSCVEAPDRKTGLGIGSTTFTAQSACTWKSVPAAEITAAEQDVDEFKGLLGPHAIQLAALHMTASSPTLKPSLNFGYRLTLMVFWQLDRPPAVRPSVVWPRDAGGDDYSLELRNVDGRNVTKMTFGSLPDAQIVTRTDTSVQFKQTVPPGTAPGRQKLTYTVSGKVASPETYLYVSGTQILDPFESLPDFLAADPGGKGQRIDTTPEKATAKSGGFARQKAIAADGVTEVFLRFVSDKPLKLSVAGSGLPDPGTLRTLDGKNAGPTLDKVLPVPDAEVGSAVWVVYRPPADLPEKSLPGGAEPSYTGAGMDDLENPDIKDPGTYAVAFQAALVSDDPAETGDNSTAVKKHRILTLVRPPLALIHGVWGYTSTWETVGFTRKMTERTGVRAIEMVNYEAANARSFDPRRKQIEAVEALKLSSGYLLSAYRRLKIAATQVDVVAHSMGGLMTRVWSQLPAQYYGNANFNKGAVHKLVTLDTPHTGSLISVFLLNNKNKTIAAFPKWETNDLGFIKVQQQGVNRMTVEDLLASLDMPINQGAIVDFRPCSDAYKALDPSPIPVHAVSGIRPETAVLGKDKRFSNSLFGILRFIVSEGQAEAKIDPIFDGPEHDTIVEAISMRGGMDYATVNQDPLSKPAHDQRDLIHAQVPGATASQETVVGSPAAQDTVARILRREVTDKNTWGLLPAPRDVRFSFETPASGKCDIPGLPTVQRIAPRPLAASSRAAESTAYIRIDQPAFGAEVTAGGTLAVKAVAEGGLAPTEVSFYGAPLVPDQTTAGGLDATLAIPAGFAGRARFGVLARDAAGNVYTGFTEVVVRPRRAPVSLTAAPTALRFSYLTQQAVLSVSGVLDDGVTVSLNRLPGLQFSSDQAAIASVTAEGVVRALAAGTATVTAAYGGVQVKIPVTVAVTAQPPIFAAVEEFTMEAGQTKQVPVSVTAQAGRAVQLRAFNVPPFARFQSSGASGTLTLTPQAAHTGVYNVEIVAEDNGSPALANTQRIRFTVVAAGGGGLPAGPQPKVARGGVVDAAQGGASVAPGGIGSVYGAELAAGVTPAGEVPLPRSLGGVKVSVAGRDAPLYFVSPGQINFQVPFETALGAANVVVTRDAVASAAEPVQVAGNAPAVFLNSSTGEPIAVHAATGQLVTAAQPTDPGETLVIYGTGVGVLNNPPPTGAAALAQPLASAPTLPEITIGGAPATALFAGLTPGFIGLVQFNLTLPPALPAGNSLPLVIKFGSAESKPVNLPVRGGGATTPPRIELSPTALNFGGVVIGQTKEMSFTVKNTGGSPLEITAFTTNNPQFTMLAPAGRLTLAPGAQAAGSVRFAPSAAGAHTGQVRVLNNDPRSPFGIITLGGEGVFNAAGVLVSDAFARTASDVCDLGRADLGLGGSGAHSYLPILAGATISGGALLNSGLDFGGVQFTAAASGCLSTSRGENLGQDLRIRVDLQVPVDAAGNVTRAGPYFRSRSAAPRDGLIGGTSAGYWVQLSSLGEVQVKRLNPQEVVARSGMLPFDPALFHTLEVTVQGANLQVALDGRLLTFYVGTAESATVPVPNTWDSPKAGNNDGALGVAFSSEDNRGRIGGQRARNLVVAPYSALGPLPVMPAGLQ